jgi:uncharacterized membrane protein YedE/YeeE
MIGSCLTITHTRTIAPFIIGLSAAVLLLLSGDILGSSGLCSSLVLHPKKAISDPRQAWKWVLVISFLVAANTILGDHFTDDERLQEDPSIPITSTYGYLIAGCFVGFGTKLGNGCTTGHGICGMARLSKRSMAAVATFMMSAFATSAMIAPDNKAFSNGTRFLRADKAPELFNRWLGFGVTCFFLIPTGLALYSLYKSQSSSEDAGKQDAKSLDKSERNSDVDKTAAFTSKDFESTVSFPALAEKCMVEEVDVESRADTSDSSNSTEQQAQQEEECMARAKAQQKKDAIRKLGPALLAGLLFAVGLAVSGMVKPSKINGFLNLFLFAQGSYDPTLLTVMMGGCIVSFMAYQFVEKHRMFPNAYARECPLVASNFSIPTSTVIDGHLIGGALCFGIGWGVGNLCPGPAMFLAATGAKPILLYWWPTFFVGSFVAEKLKG